MLTNERPATRHQPRPSAQLADFNRAREVLGRYGLDAVVCAIPHNVHYLTGLDTPPLWEFPWYAFAVLPRVGEPALVLSNLALSAPAEMDLWAKDLYPFFRSEMIVYDASAILESEAMIRDLSTSLISKRSGTIYEATMKALADRGAANGKVGFDDSRLLPRLDAPGIQAFDAIEVLREIRMVKTEAEIERMRAVAVANEEAAMEAAKFIPWSTSWQEVINHYSAELALRGGRTSYLLGGAPHHTGTHQHSLHDYALAPGDFIMIDALGTKNHYFGDFGRTISYGEPNKLALSRYNAMRRGFQAGFEFIRPGMPFEQVTERVTEVVRANGVPQFSVCVLHSVGMEHTDTPRTPGHVVQANMTMNLDIAYLEAGFGALHLEDTFVVRQNGNELLTSGKSEMLVV
jgi:Xaa-Pro aminopeptidase